MLYEAPQVIAGLLLDIAFVMMRGPNKSLKHQYLPSNRIIDGGKYQLFSE